MSQLISPVQEVVRSFIDFFLQGNVPAMLELLSEDVEWEVPGSSAIAWTGLRKGPTQVVEFLSLLPATLEPLAFEPRFYFGDDRQALVLGYFKWLVKATGRYIEGEWVIRFTVRDGKITGYKVF